MFGEKNLHELYFLKMLYPFYFAFAVVSTLFFGPRLEIALILSSIIYARIEVISSIDLRQVYEGSGSAIVVGISVLFVDVIKGERIYCDDAFCTDTS